MKKKNILIVLLLVCVAVGAVIMFPLFSNDGEYTVDVSGDEFIPEPPKPIEIEIVCVGDVMGHMSHVNAQAMGDGSYDFTNNFKYVKKYIEAADLAICNVETTFGGEPYTGYPSFSTPDSLADAILDAGFDVASTANNHMVDRGMKGVISTLEVLRSRGLRTTGSIIMTQQEIEADAESVAESESDAESVAEAESDAVAENAPLYQIPDTRYAMYNVKGVDIAVIGYTYETPTGNGRVAINGSVISNELAEHINSFSYSDIDQDLLKIKGTVDEAKAAGADIVILFYHWGEEYQLQSNKWQKYIAEKSIEFMDVDIIFGSHPHVLQETELYTRTEIPNTSGSGVTVTVTARGEESYQEAVPSAPNTAPSAPDTAPNAPDTAIASDGGITVDAADIKRKEVPVFYSLGNFISNQRVETLDNRYTEEGAIAKVNLSIIPETGEIQWIKMSAIPTWVDRHRENGKLYYHIIPLDAELQNNETLAVSGHLTRAEKAWEDADEILRINR